ncbi:restriction endonuclease subunit S [Neisseria subflava]|uniref:restriction endonuclease subunit S n=1 Tax=Neisseria subflava TaxID=28449 RepID=UPI0020B7E334|nr:restriction endonuclease subunit S [Neisseria subflava]UTG73413.1 restriction endonuclease subunit S [Neisseria subflava]
MKSYTLKDACYITTGKLDANQSIKNGIYPFFTCAEFPDAINTYAFDCDAVLVAGNNARGNFHVNRYKGKFNAYQRTYVLTSKENFDIDFIFYSLKLELKRLKEKSQGSQTKFLTLPILQNIHFSSILINEQKSIAAVLSALDKKIALNKQINARLEEMAKTLYDYWFVQFDFPDTNGKPYKSSGGEMVFDETLKREIPKGWEVKKLKDAMQIVRGASPRPIDDFLSDNGIPWIKISDATATSTPFIFKTKEFIKSNGKQYSRYLYPNTLILSNSATPGIPRIVELECCVHDGWLIIENLKNGLFNEFMYFYFLNFKEKIINLGSGSIFKNLKTEYIKELDLIIPNKETLENAKTIFSDVFKKIKNTQKQNHQLTQLRDFLLPMLMNGQVSVTE